MALGADRYRILGMVLREAGTLLGIGLVFGLAIALASARAATALLFGLKPHDPLTLALACGGLGVISIAAAFFPAKRASALDPMVALRQE
jgi:ABC-type antimicrobial peptide transport system permease subunit